MTDPWKNQSFRYQDAGPEPEVPAQGVDRWNEWQTWFRRSTNWKCWTHCHIDENGRVRYAVHLRSWRNRPDRAAAGKGKA